MIANIGDKNYEKCYFNYLIKDKGSYPELNFDIVKLKKLLKTHEWSFY